MRALWLVDDNDTLRRERSWQVMLDELARTWRRTNQLLDNAISPESAASTEKLVRELRDISRLCEHLDLVPLEGIAAVARLEIAETVTRPLSSRAFDSPETG